MKIVRSIKQMQKISRGLKAKGHTLGFVPTMGCLHEGHLSLLRCCKKENDVSVLSIFVNPTQFGPHEDFSRYPRNIKKDKLFASQEKVDIIFYPSVVEMYPLGFSTSLDPGPMGNVLCGKFRPGHFKGVVTIVAKLLNAVSPDKMYLGQKDAQQAIILTKMVEDLNFATIVKVLPTVREQNGLALSSRNTYLSDVEKTKAAVIYQALKKAKQLIKNGERRPQIIINLIRSAISQKLTKQIDYIACVNAENLSSLKTLKGKILIALAVRVGSTRLIDNILVNV